MRFPSHMLAAATPLSPEARASFEDKEIRARCTNPGLAIFPDAVILAHYDSVYTTGQMDRSDVVGELTCRIGGDFLRISWVARIVSRPII